MRIHSHRDGAKGGTLQSGVARAAAWIRLLTPIGIGAGVLLVFLSQTGMRWFYGHFGVSLEEIGQDRPTILFETAASGFFVLLASLIVAGTISVSLFTARKARHPDRPSGGIELLGLPRAPLLRTVAVITGLLLASYFGWGVATAQQSLDRIREGLSARPQTFAHGEIHATCVQVWDVDTRLVQLLGAPGTERFVYLGEGRGLTILYDPRRSATLRLPSANLAMRSC